LATPFRIVCKTQRPRSRAAAPPLPFRVRHNASGVAPLFLFL
jgi:hypothetical protein